MSNELKFKSQPDSTEVLIQAKYTLFVEGTLDYNVFRVLMDGLPLSVKSMSGGSSSLRRVANAIHEHNSDYLFLIDRDHFGMNEVNKLRKNFNEEGKPNILMWKLREIENYFLNPGFLTKFKNLNLNDTNVNKLKQMICNKIRESYLIDVANHAISSVIGNFNTGFKNLRLKRTEIGTPPEKVIDLIKSNGELRNFLTERQQNLTSALDNIIKNYKEVVNELESVEGEERYLSTKFLEHINGKYILREIIAHSMFKCADQDGNDLDGDKRIVKVITEIVKNPENIPPDFLEVQNLIRDRVNENAQVM